MKSKETLKAILEEQVKKDGHPSLFRLPLLGFSQGNDARYEALKTIIGPWHQLPENILPGVQTVISFFVPFTKEVTASVRDYDTVSPLWRESYVKANELIGKISDALIGFLEGEGYIAGSVAATHTFDKKTLQTGWSHRSAAVISGLGSFGVNHMVITKKGSSGRFGTVFTSAPMEIEDGQSEERCTYQKNGKCLRCVKACPVGALQETSFDPFLCYQRVLDNAAEFTGENGIFDVCGKCLAGCPKAILK